MALSYTLKLYQAAGSPNSRRVRIFLVEKELVLTLVPVDLGKGEQRSYEYRRINPRQVVPTLVLGDGTAIGEVPAIWRYLEDPARTTTSRFRRSSIGASLGWQHFLSDLDARLTDSPFVAGEQFSAADITALVTVDFAASALGVSAAGEHRALRHWHSAVSSRPSISA
jgi:glutathione S-transferase